jgi:membrane-associated phospholipid phosphatase
MAERRWEPHELALLALGTGTAVALAVRAGPLSAITLQVGLATVLFGAAIALAHGRSGERWQKARLAAAYPFTLWFYSAVRAISPALGLPLRDGALLALDRALFGETPAVAFAQVASSSLTDALSGCYLSYQVYLHAALAWALLGGLEAARRLYRLLFSLFAVGLIGYLLVPAVGPGQAFPILFPAPLQGGALAEANAWVVSHGSSVYDVFPSLHIAITAALLAHDARKVVWRFRAMLPIVVGLAFSTLYLRYHYAVDLFAGGALAAALVAAFRCAELRAIALECPASGLRVQKPMPRPAEPIAREARAPLSMP